MARRRKKYPIKSPPGSPEVRVEVPYTRVLYTGRTITNLWQGLLGDAEDRGKTHVLGGVEMKVRLAPSPWRAVVYFFLFCFAVAVVVAILSAVLGCGPTDQCRPVKIGGAIVIGAKCDYPVDAGKR